MKFYFPSKAQFLLTAIAIVPLISYSAIKENEDRTDIEIWLGEGVGRYGDREFKIRGGSQKYPTPTGAFKVEWKSKNWWSRQYDAAMPYAQFYYNGAALHQGSMNGNSHGCIRLTENDAKYLYTATKEKETRVFIYP